MDLTPAHLHLILNHIPVLGTMLFAPLVLLWGLVRGSREVTQVGLMLAVLLAITAVPIYLTGEPAEEQLERQPWFDEHLVEVHEERAEAGLVTVLLTGVAAAVALWLGRRGQSYRAAASRLVVLGLLISAGLFALAALEGGQIRHDEIRPGAAPGAP